MAGIKHQLKAYVLLESMIAMIVVMLCFGFSVAIYNKLVSGARNHLKILARIRLENEATASKSEKRFLDETLRYDEFRIEKQILPFENSTNLYQLHYTAIAEDGKILAEYNELIYNP